MNLLPYLQVYYKGERFEAALIVLLGVISLLACLAMWYHINENPMLKGLFYLIAFLGLFAFSAGIFNFYNNNRRLADMPGQYQTNRQQYMAKEIARFEGKNGVNTWWMPLKISWTALIITGLLLTLLTKNAFVNGIAIGLILLGAFGLLIDGFAHQRARIYTDALLKAG